MEDIVLSLCMALMVLVLLFGDEAMALARQVVGRPAKGLSKKQAKRLQCEHAEAIDILREIDAYDRFATNVLPSDAHDRLRRFLDAHRGQPALPQRDDPE